MPDVLRPLFDQVVIKELEPDRMRRSGLLVPEGTSDVPPNEGIVLAAGGGPPELPDFKMPVKPGDHVVFPRSAGVWVEIEDERLLVCRVREILGVIETDGRLGGRGDPAGDDGGVLADPVEQRRLALAQEVHAGEPEARRGASTRTRRAPGSRARRRRRARDPARVVGAVAGGGDDGAEALRSTLRQRLGVERPGSGSSGSGSPRSATARRTSSRNWARRASPHATLAARSSAKRTWRPSEPSTWPASRTPFACSVRRCRSWPPPRPVAVKLAAKRAAGAGSESTVASM